MNPANAIPSNPPPALALRALVSSAAMESRSAVEDAKSLLLDRAYDEYCECIERGDPVDPDEFCEKFPAYQSSLHRMLEAHRFLHENPLVLRNLQPIRWPEVGETFLGFSLVRVLGQGAFARVYLARETAMGGRLVAVKISRHGAAEAGTLGRLDHPNVVPVHSVQADASSGLSVICMPYLGSATLCDLVDRAAAGGSPPLDGDAIRQAIETKAAAEVDATRRAERLWRGSYVDGVRRIALAMAEALAFVHSKGILHRDLKPSNVLLGADGQPRLLDFNLSKDDSATEHQIGGTPPYMSPEQLQAIFASNSLAAATLDVRTDLFSLGVILYELLTGRHPFGPIPLKLKTEELRAYLLERQRQGPRPLRELNPRVDPCLARLVERCLAFDRHDRPESAAALASAIRKSMSFPQRAWRWARNRSWKVRSAALSVLLAVVVSIVLLSLRDPYSVRQWKRGQEHYREGRYAEAVACYDRALEENPNLTAALFDRGRAKLKQGEFALALIDFQKANEVKPTGRTHACIGFCMSSLKQHAAAIDCYLKAIESGYAPGEVYNDLGYSYLLQGKQNDAKKAFDEAVLRNANVAASYHNRALIHLNWARNGRPESIALGVADVEKALELGMSAADFYRDAACLFALAERYDAALECLNLAVDRGFDLRRSQKDDNFLKLHGKPAFLELAARPPLGVTPSKAARLVDPINDRE